MNKTICAIMCLLLVSGCGKRKPTASQPQSAVSRFATSPLPVPPPTPDLTPTAADVTGAASDIEAAQASVQTVLKVAQGTPAAAAAVAPLANADAHLTTALAWLADATQRITTLTEEIHTVEAQRDQAQAIMQKDIETLKTAAGKDAQATSKTISALQAENDDLRNEAMQSVQKRMYILGALLVLAGIGSVFASFYFGFAIGSKLGVPMGILGCVLIGFAHMLPKLALYSEYGIMAGAVALLAYLAWHFFHHEPVKSGLPAGGTV